jgi:hypothetical protein
MSPGEESGVWPASSPFWPPSPGSRTASMTSGVPGGAQGPAAEGGGWLGYRAVTASGDRPAWAARGGGRITRGRATTSRAHRAAAPDTGPGGRLAPATAPGGKVTMAAGGRGALVPSHGPVRDGSRERGSAPAHLPSGQFTTAVMLVAVLCLARPGELRVELSSSAPPDRVLLVWTHWRSHTLIAQEETEPRLASDLASAPRHPPPP